MDRNWPQFRGSRAGVAADDARLPDTWSTTENVAWKIDVPGRSWSSPVVWEDHVFLTSAISSGDEKAPVTGLYDDQGLLDHVGFSVDKGETDPTKAGDRPPRRRP